MPEIHTCGLCDAVLTRLSIAHTYSGPQKSRGFLGYAWVQETFCSPGHLLTWLASNVED